MFSFPSGKYFLLLLQNASLSDFSHSTGEPFPLLKGNLSSSYWKIFSPPSGKKCPFITGKYLSFPLGNISLSYWEMYSFCNGKCFPFPLRKVSSFHVEMFPFLVSKFFLSHWEMFSFLLGSVFPSHWEMISFPFPQETEKKSPHPTKKCFSFPKGKCLSIQFPNWKYYILLTYCTSIVCPLKWEST